jgi:hypothetical protein
MYFQWEPEVGFQESIFGRENGEIVHSLTTIQHYIIIDCSSIVHYLLCSPMIFSFYFSFQWVGSGPFRPRYYELYSPVQAHRYSWLETRDILKRGSVTLMSHIYFVLHILRYFPAVWRLLLLYLGVSMSRWYHTSLSHCLFYLRCFLLLALWSLDRKQRKKKKRNQPPLNNALAPGGFMDTRTDQSNWPSVDRHADNVQQPLRNDAWIMNITGWWQIEGGCRCWQTNPGTSQTNLVIISWIIKTWWEGRQMVVKTDAVGSNVSCL